MKTNYAFLLYVLILVLTFSCNIRDSPREIATIQIINQSGLDDAHAISCEFSGPGALILFFGAE